jgi:hypothetical protein
MCRRAILFAKFVNQGASMISTVRTFLVSGLAGLMTLPAFAADVTTQSTPLAVKPAASAAVATPPVVKHLSTSSTSISAKAGDKQIPGTAVTPPKPPKKEVLESAGALKAKTGQ